MKSSHSPSRLLAEDEDLTVSVVNCLATHGPLEKGEQ